MGEKLRRTNTLGCRKQGKYEKEIRAALRIAPLMKWIVQYGCGCTDEGSKRGLLEYCGTHGTDAKVWYPVLVKPCETPVLVKLRIKDKPYQRKK